MKRVAGYGLCVAGKKGHRAWGMGHRVRHCTMEGAGGSKRLWVYLVDWLTGLNKLIEQK